MNIALIGYGKMGKEIEEISVQRGHKILLRISSSNIQDFTPNNFSLIDTAIEFTTPFTAFENVKKCLDYRVPVVSGSTGWNDKVEELKNYCLDKNGCFLYASNFSIGVQILFAMNRFLAQLMAPQPDYEVSIREIHHTQKKDAPSGTAVTLAEQIISINPHKNKWVSESTASTNEIPIFSKRIDPAPGTHVIKYASPIDDIELIHSAHSRKGFALGAVLAAEFISGKKGVFSMSDVLGFDNF
jgi:4-hydroxy-tetrahydrodipicolinate reductase